MNWGRFTARGSDAIETSIRDMIKEIAETLQTVLKPSQFTAVVMIGGYGRGEGGIDVSSGIEKPHNNFDFLVITNHMSDKEQRELKLLLDQTLAPLSQKYSLSFDLGTINATKLARSGCLVMWYDMRYGHKTILGDPHFVSSQTHFKIDSVPAWDVRNLLVNRGTLLIINELLMQSKELSEELKRVVIKHAIKAIIGYGDAYLYALNEYHWSYEEKQMRMQHESKVPEDFRKLYDEAMEFRFQPDYATYLNRDLQEWMQQLRVAFEPVHLYFESVRLNQKGMVWQLYPRLALEHIVFEEPTSIKKWAKKFRNMLKASSSKPLGSLGAGLGYKFSDKLGLLTLLFPKIAYHLDHTAWNHLTEAVLGVSNLEISKLRSLYLAKWAQYGDLNFTNFLKKYDIQLEEVTSSV